MSNTEIEKEALRLFEEAPEEGALDWLEAQDAPEAVKARVRALLDADVSGGLSHLQTGGAAQAADEEVAPERIGAYRIAGLIGRGGMGAVYRGEREAGDFEHAVAIKVVRPGPLASALADRFRRERAILAGLDHPNIARLFDGGETVAGSPYFVMEHVEGVTLQAVLERKDHSLEHLLDLFKQVCRAVAYAHQKLIAHGDITPANILVKPDGQAKLIDFGISRLDEAERAAIAQAGLPPIYTRAYAAPERLAGEPVSASADIYALGRVLADLAEAAGASDDREIAAIASKAGHDERGQRYDSVSAVIAELERRERGFPVEAVRGGTAYRTRKLVGRHRLLFGSIAASMLALTVALAVIFGLYRQAETARSAEAERFNQVRTLAGFMLFQLNERLSRTPGNTAAREALADKAQTYLSQLAASKAAGPDLQLETARGLIQLAIIQGVPPDPNLGKKAEATANLAAAEKILAGLAAKGVAPATVTALQAKLLAHRSMVVLLRDSDAERAGKLLTEAETRLGAVAAPQRNAEWFEARRTIRRGQLEHADISNELAKVGTLAEQLEREIADWPAAMQKGPAASEDRVFAHYFRGLSQLYQSAGDHGLAHFLKSRETLAALPPEHGGDPKMLFMKVYVPFMAMEAAQAAGQKALATELITEARATMQRLIAIEPNDDMVYTLSGNVNEAYANDLSNRGLYKEAIALQKEVVAGVASRLKEGDPDRPIANANLAWAEMMLGLMARKAGDRALTCESWERAEVRFAKVETSGKLLGFHKDFLPGLRANLVHCRAGRPVSAFGPLR
jgi:eukaryotic-like serine/threonine-protein kinase